MKTDSRKEYARLFVVLLALGILTASPVLAQTASKKQAPTKKDKYWIHFTKDKTSKTGAYVPRDLSDALVELDKILSPALRAKMQKGTEEQMNQYHMNLGVGMRNEWGLWKRLRLSKWFLQQGIFHPDDMSGILLTSYWRHLNHKPIGFAAQVEFYKDYWKQAEIADMEEKRRVVKAKSAIRAMMLGMIVEGKPKQTISFPRRIHNGIRVRYMAHFADGILVTAKVDNPESRGRNYDSSDFITPCYFLNTNRLTLHPIQLAEMSQLEEGIVIDGNAYFHGTAKSKDILLEIRGKERIPIALPPGKGRMRLGIEKIEGHSGRMLAIRGNTISLWQDGNWETIQSSDKEFPRCAVPPEQLGDRLYFRDEGYGEDNKSLSWLDLKEPSSLVRFEKDIGVIGVEGPRWENIWSYARAGDGTLWLTAGTDRQTLLTWNKENGYRIALVNDSIGFNGDLFGYSGSGDDTESRTLSITGIAPCADSSVNVVGPNGLFHIQSHHIHPVFYFKNIPDWWTPTHLMELGTDSWLVGGHWGGMYLIRKDTRNKYVALSLDEKMGIPLAL